MEAKEQILAEIKRIVLKFPAVKVRYENDVLSNAHFLEVSANENFNFQSKDYLSCIEDITFRFIGMFPLQNISFISEDSLVGLDKVDFELKGILYRSIYAGDFLNIKNYKIGDVYSSSFYKGSLINKITHLSYPWITKDQSLSSNKAVNDKFEVSKIVGDSNYSLAA
jgi:hypothetical protein